MHKNGSFIFAQIAALGRFAIPQILQAGGDYDVVSASDIPVEGGVKPRPLTTTGLFQKKSSFTQCGLTTA